jgi:hypothetical protein
MSPIPGRASDAGPDTYRRDEGDDWRDEPEPDWGDE